MGHGITCDIGIVGFDCFPEMEACLESIFSAEKQGLDRVFVVENSSREIPMALKSKFPDVIWENSSQNLGFARACNRIISRGSAPYILLLNPDTLVVREFLREALAWMETHRDVAVLGPRILDADGTLQPSARTFPRIDTAFFGRTSLLTRLFPSNAFSGRNLTAMSCREGPAEVDWVSGACMMVRRSATRDVGLLDEGFFMYWEDCDWCTRFRNAGWKVIYHPSLGPVRHMAGSSSRRAPLLTHFHFHRSAARLYVKYDRTLFKAGSVVAVTGAVCRYLLLLPGVFFGCGR